MAGSLKNTAETALLNLIFKNTAWTGIGDAGGLLPSVGTGNLYVALYTAAPSDAAQGTECVYTGYARKAVARGAGFTVAGNTVSNAAAVTFDPCTALVSQAIAFAYCASDVEGTDDAILWGDITTPPAGLTISVGISSNFAIGVLTVTAD